MARPLIRPTRMMVSPRTRRSSDVPDVSGSLSALKTRWEPWIPFEDRERRVWPERKSVGGTCSRGEHEREEKLCFLKPLFVGRLAAKRYGVREGAYLANCSGQSDEPGKHPTDLIPVRGRRDALAKARTFCACREDGGEARRCAKRVGGRGVEKPSGRKRRRR